MVDGIYLKIGIILGIIFSASLIVGNNVVNMLELNSKYGDVVKIVDGTRLNCTPDTQFVFSLSFHSTYWYIYLLISLLIGIIGYVAWYIRGGYVND